MKDLEISFHPDKWDKLISDPNGLWYASEEIWPVIEGLFVNPPKDLSEDKRIIKEKVIEYFAQRLAENMIVLGNRPMLFNDDDRWSEKGGWKVPIDTIVIHHTFTSSRLKYEELNVHGLLRLYSPLYKNLPSFQINGELQPISSGHFYDNQQTFVGYHYIVYDVGKLTGLTTQLLDDRCIGFHAGNYGVNCRSIGIAVVGDLMSHCPQVRTISAINTIISRYPDAKVILGHKDVERRDGKTTLCPGDKWDEWKGLLKLPV